MPKILINISRGYKMHDYYDFAYKDLYENHNIKTIIFFDKNLSKSNTIVNTSFYEILFYDSKKDLIHQISQINKDDIYFINTFDEILVSLLHDIRIHLGLNVSDKYIAFRNKHIQREVLSKYFPETTVKYFDIDIQKQNIEEYCYKLDFPYIIKPSSGVQSAGVGIIHNKTDLENYIKTIDQLNKNMVSRGIENNVFLIEDYIEGDMFTIVYFVDNDGNITYSPVVKVDSAQNLGINDFFNYVRLSGTIIDDEFSFEEVKTFIEKQASAFGMRNTYMFQEFKKNNNGVLKNIELNARIGGYRLEMMQKIYGYNLLEMPLGITTEFQTDFSNAVFVFYPKTNGILKNFNEKLINDFKSLESYSSIRISHQKIGKPVGLTKDGFGSIVALRLKNHDIIQFQNDYKFVEDNYNNLIILEQ